jgi:hypothetical protein
MPGVGEVEVKEVIMRYRMTPLLVLLFLLSGLLLASSAASAQRGCKAITRYYAKTGSYYQYDCGASRSNPCVPSWWAWQEAARLCPNGVRTICHKNGAPCYQFKPPDRIQPEPGPTSLVSLVPVGIGALLPGLAVGVLWHYARVRRRA